MIAKSRRIFKLSIVTTIVILFLFMPLTAIKSLANNFSIQNFFSHNDFLDSTCLSLAVSSIKIDNAKKNVTITCNHGSYSKLKIKNNPENWTIVLKKFQALYFVNQKAANNIKLETPGCSFILEGNTFTGTTTNIAVVNSIKGIEYSFPSDEETDPTRDETDPSEEPHDEVIDDETQYNYEGFSDNNNNNNNKGTKDENQNSNSEIDTSIGSHHIVNNANYTVTGINTVSLTKSSATSKKINVPSSITINNRSYNVTEIEPNAFRNNKKLKDVNLPWTLTSIGERAFYGCKNLKAIKCSTISLKSIKRQAFKGIKKNAKIKIIAKSKKEYNNFVKQIKKAASRSDLQFIMIKE